MTTYIAICQLGFQHSEQTATKSIVVAYVNLHKRMTPKSNRKKGMYNKWRWQNVTVAKLTRALTNIIGVRRQALAESAQETCILIRNCPMCTNIELLVSCHFLGTNCPFEHTPVRINSIIFFSFSSLPLSPSCRLTFSRLLWSAPQRVANVCHHTKLFVLHN